MNKIISINIGGVIFHIEEDAYQVLAKYLESVSRYFRTTEGSKEIIADIEGRIAEMLQEKLRGKKEALVMEDIDDVVHRMGRPQEFADEAGEEYAEETEYPAAAPAYRSRGRLFRDPDDKILGGVCSGISARFDLDPVWIRLAFVLAVIFFGTGILLYIILWIIIPEARTPAEKLEMRGEEVTISNIEKSFRDEFDGLKKKFGKVSENSEAHLRKWRRSTSGGLTAAGDVVKKLLSVFLILAGLIGLVVVVMFLLSLFGVAAVAFPLVSPLVFVHDWQFITGIISLSLLFLIPVAFLVYTGLRLLLGRTSSIRWAGPSLLALWIVGWVGTLALTGLVIAEFSSFKSVHHEIPVSVQEYETLYIDIIREDKMQMNQTVETVWLDFLGTLYITEDHISISNVRLEVVPSNDSLAHLSVYRSSRGRTSTEASSNAENIAVEIQQKDSTLFLSALMDIGDHSLYRNQKVRIVLSLPQGKKVSFSPSTGVITDNPDDWNGRNEYYSGNTWEIKPGGMICLTCGSVNERSFPYKKEYSTEGFEELKVEGNLKVIFQTDSTPSITVAGNEILVSEIYVVQKGATLLLRYKDRHWNKYWIGRNQNAVIYLRTPDLYKLSIKDKATVELIGNISKYLSIEMHDLARLRVETNSPESGIGLHMEDASGALMSGSVATMNLSLHDISNLEAAELSAREISIEAQDASKAKVFAVHILKGNISDAARLNYKGNPEVSAEKKGAGSISRVF